MAETLKKGTFLADSTKSNSIFGAILFAYLFPLASAICR
ncbi:Uncharacterised protein [Serratia grimesii]|nr:Uncharacterised protein [Serratia grimesii]SMZ56169.1 Uncharacterised protein [Serratia grimesii]